MKVKFIKKQIFLLSILLICVCIQSREIVLGDDQIKMKAEDMEDISESSFNVEKYGARCDGVSDDSAAWNKAIEKIRNHTVRDGLPSPVKVVGCTNRRSLVRSTINMTALRPPKFRASGVTIDMNGTCIIGETNGKPVIDALGSREIYFDHLCVWGSSNNPPSIGIQIGRYDYNSNADMFYFNRPIIRGSFKFAALYDFASETNTFVDPYIENDISNGSGYAVVLDGYNHFSAHSDFIKVTSQSDQGYSFNENVFINGWFGGGQNNIPVWIGKASRHRFIGSYFVTGTNVGLILFNENGSTSDQLYLDVHFESTGIPNAIMVSGQNSKPVFRGFTYIDNRPECAGSVISIDKNIDSATIVDGTIKISSFDGVGGKKIFSQPKKWTYSGFVYAPSIDNWDAIKKFTGTICLFDECIQKSSNMGWELDKN